MEFGRAVVTRALTEMGATVTQRMDEVGVKSIVLSMNSIMLSMKSSILRLFWTDLGLFDAGGRGVFDGRQEPLPSRGLPQGGAGGTCSLLLALCSLRLAACSLRLAPCSLRQESACHLAEC